MVIVKNIIRIKSKKNMKFKTGDKVVPHSKTIGIREFRSLERSHKNKTALFVYCRQR